MNNMFPKHLHNIIVPDTGHLGENSMLHGELVCTCGEKNFAVQIFAVPQKNNITVKEYEGLFTIYIAIQCAKCGKKWLVFDYTKHGYNAIVCKNDISIPDHLIEGWNCPKCKGDLFGVKIAIEPEDREQFIKDIIRENSDMSADDYIEAFGWIVIDLICSRCSHEMERWVDLETS